jgi:hypothetical protein
VKYRVILLLLSITAILFAAQPRTINYQGKLTNPSGVALHDTHTEILFSIWTAPTGGTMLWDETHDVYFNHGLFDVILGTEESFPPEMDFSEPYWLQLRVDFEVLSPRQPFSAVPYAIHSVKSDTAVFTHKVAGGTDNYIVRWNGANELEASLLYQTDDGRVAIGTTTPGGNTRFEVRGAGGGGEKAIAGISSTGPEGWLGTDLYGVYGNFNSDNYGFLGASGYGVFAKGDLHAGYFEGDVTIEGNLNAWDVNIEDDLYLTDPSRIYIGGVTGTTGQVLKVDAAGRVYWGDDITGSLFTIPFPIFRVEPPVNTTIFQKLNTMA